MGRSQLWAGFTCQGGMRPGEPSGTGRRGRGCAGAAGAASRGLHHRFLLYGDCTCGQSGVALGWHQDHGTCTGWEVYPDPPGGGSGCQAEPSPWQGWTLPLPQPPFTHLAAPGVPGDAGVPGLCREGVLGSERGAGAARQGAGGGTGQDHVVGTFALRDRHGGVTAPGTPQPRGCRGWKAQRVYTPLKQPLGRRGHGSPPPTPCPPSQLLPSEAWQDVATSGVTLTVPLCIRAISVGW